MDRERRLGRDLSLYIEILQCGHDSPRVSPRELIQKSSGDNPEVRMPYSISLCWIPESIVPNEFVGFLGANDKDFCFSEESKELMNFNTMTAMVMQT